MAGPPPIIPYKSSSRPISNDRKKAIRYLRGLGTLFFILGALALLISPCLVLGAIPFGTSVSFCLLVVASMIFVPFILGCVYRSCAAEVEQRNLTALRIALVLTAISLAVSILSLAVGLVQRSPFTLVSALFIIGFARAILKLAQVRREIL